MGFLVMHDSMACLIIHSFGRRRTLYIIAISTVTPSPHFAHFDSLVWIAGTSVEVRYIAVDIIRTGVFTNTSVSYSIDGVPRGTAVRNPENRNSYVFDQSLFKVTGLANVEHTLWVDLSPPSVLLVSYKCCYSSMKLLI